AGFSLVLSLYLQIGLGRSAFDAGLAFLPWSIGTAIGAGAGASLVARLGRRLVHLGLAVMALGTGGLLVVLETAEQVTTWAMSPPPGSAGGGMGRAMARSSTFVPAAWSRREPAPAPAPPPPCRHPGGPFG